MTVMLSGSLLLLAALGFLVRVAIGTPGADRWPTMCLGSRMVCTVMAAATMMRGVSLLRGHGTVGSASLLMAAIIALYSVVMAITALKEHHPSFYDRMLKKAHSS